MDDLFLKEREAFLSKAESNIEISKYRHARECAEERLSRFPGDVDAWLVCAACAVREGRFAEAHTILQDLDSILPGWPHIQECLGDMFSQRGMRAEAQECYSRALHPDETLRKRIALKMGGHDNAAEEKGGEDPVGGEGEISCDFHTIALADLYLNQGDTERACDVVKVILNDDPANREANRIMKRIATLRTPENAEIIRKLAQWLTKLERAGELHGQ